MGAYALRSCTCTHWCYLAGRTLLASSELTWGSGTTKASSNVPLHADREARKRRKEEDKKKQEEEKAVAAAAAATAADGSAAQVGGLPYLGPSYDQAGRHRCGICPLTLS